MVAFPVRGLRDGSEVKGVRARDLGVGAITVRWPDSVLDG
jgi:hypothetical protein